MKTYIKFCLSTLFILSSFLSQAMDCSKFCVLKVEMDSTGAMLVTIYNGDSVGVNYPTIQVINGQGDTIGNPAGTFNLFLHPAGDTVVHQIPSTVSSLPFNFYGTVLITDQIWDTTCVLNYPMPCSQHSVAPDCNFLEVQDISLDSTATLMKVKLYNNCGFCASGFNGPVYCEMRVMRTVAPFDTLGASNCHCLLTPSNNNFLNYTITSYVSSLPPIHEMMVVFSCGSGLCDTLETNVHAALPDLYEEHRFTLFPNPATDRVQVLMSAGMQADDIEVYSLAGMKVNVAIDKKGSIDTSNLSAGLYLVQIVVGGQRQVLKLVISE